MTGPRGIDAADGEKEPLAAQLTRAIVKAVVVAVPLSIVLFVGLVALALHNESPDWTAYLSMGAGIGLLNGAFFGMLAGFVRSAHLFDD